MIEETSTPHLSSRNEGGSTSANPLSEQSPAQSTQHIDIEAQATPTLITARDAAFPFNHYLRFARWAAGTDMAIDDILSVLNIVATKLIDRQNKHNNISLGFNSAGAALVTILITTPALVVAKDFYDEHKRDGKNGLEIASQILSVMATSLMAVSPILAALDQPVPAVCAAGFANICVIAQNAINNINDRIIKKDDVSGRDAIADILSTIGQFSLLAGNTYTLATDGFFESQKDIIPFSPTPTSSSAPLQENVFPVNPVKIALSCFGATCIVAAFITKKSVCCETKQTREVLSVGVGSTEGDIEMNPIPQDHRIDSQDPTLSEACSMDPFLASSIPSATLPLKPNREIRICTIPDLSVRRQKIIEDQTKEQEAWGSQNHGGVPTEMLPPRTVLSPTDQPQSETGTFTPHSGMPLMMHGRPAGR